MNRVDRMMHSKLAGRGPGDFWRGDFWECVGSFRVGIRVKPEVDPPKDSSLTRGVSIDAGEMAKSFYWNGKVASGALTATRILCFRIIHLFSVAYVFVCAIAMCGMIWRKFSRKSFDILSM